jgi:hypothetical protein
MAAKDFATCERCAARFDASGNAIHEGRAANPPSEWNGPAGRSWKHDAELICDGCWFDEADAAG